MLELLLRREGLLYQVSVEATEPKDEYAKQGRYESGNDAPPVGWHCLPENFHATQIWILSLGQIVIYY